MKCFIFNLVSEVGPEVLRDLSISQEEVLITNVFSERRTMGTWETPYTDEFFGGNIPLEAFSFQRNDKCHLKSRSGKNNLSN